MYLTQSDIIVQKIKSDALQAQSTLWNDLIHADQTSKDKTEMIVANRYYDGEHDILTKKRTYYVDGKEVENQAKSNYKIRHLFYTIITKQCSSYVCAKPVTLSLKRPDPADKDNPTPQEQAAINLADNYQNDLTELLGDKFHSINADWISGSIKQGTEYLHVYIAEKGEFCYTITPALGCIPIYDSRYQTNIVGFVRYYPYELVMADGSTKDLFKLEYWDDKQVEYWIQDEDKQWRLDDTYPVNPKPHWVNKETAPNGDVIKYERNSWNKVPFIALSCNSEARSVLYMIKDLIDAYDDVKSGWIDDIKDFNKLLLVIKNYRGLSEEARSGLSELGMFVKNFMEHGALLVDDEGGAEKLNTDIPVEAKEKFLNLTRKEIFFFGMALDMTEEKLGNSPSGTALKFQYSQLDMKANELITKAKLALKDFFWFATEWINRTQNKKYDIKLIDTAFNKSVIVNEKEIIDSLNSSDISEETYLENHPYVSDVQKELQRKRQDEQRQTELNKVDLNEINPE